MIDATEAKARETLAACERRGWMLATVESCTGGLVAAALTDIPGSSRVVERGFITYSNEAKVDLVDVPMALIEAHGAVSAEVAAAMAAGGLARSRAEIAVAVTGVAGPGGTEAKPEGLVCFHVATAQGRSEGRLRRFGPVGRDRVRALSVAEALDLTLTMAERL